MLLGLVDKNKLGIVLLLAKLHTYKTLVNNTSLNTSLHFSNIFKKYEEQQYVSVISLADHKFKNNYLRQGGYVFAWVCLWINEFVRLFLSLCVCVNKVTQKFMDEF